MERSGRRERISTREKSCPARSRSVSRVRGKSIMVPRIGKTSVGPGVGDCMVALMALAEVSGATDSGVGDALRLYRLFPVANRVNFREDAEDRWSASRAPVVALLP